ncbi:oligosaccharide flippase family protein [Acinetobacter sp. BMW17]|uniref:oligosaccharide flippase family protein n=1 Tax=Acinetobacter sp. BMW17 TaxID=1795629 RepID=UPI000783FB0B|nr:oligosaccharide flippase family protein [Acinetobacter sp. BMW17]
MGIFSRKIVSNSLWMMLEKFIGIFGVIFVMSYVAKYIGPENFGKIALSTTLFTFVQTLTWFGNQEILFKRVSKNTRSGLQYLANTQNIRQVLFLIFSLPILVSLYLFSDSLTLLFAIATAFSSYFVTQDIYTIFNNATLHSYINATSNIIGLAIALLIRYIIIEMHLDYAYLALPIVLVTLIPFCLKKFIFNSKNQAKKVISVSYRKYYLWAGSALVISSLSVSFYTQITSLMLAGLTSTRELGIYASAITIGSAWTFINVAVITSVLSKIYKEKNHFESYKMVAKLNLLIIFISLCVITVLALLGKWIITTLYGAAYSEAYHLLLILAAATMCAGLGTVAARLMIKEENYAYISKKMLVVAVSSLPISYLMIHFFGLIGAAYSVLLIEFLSLTVFNYFYKNGLIFKIHFFPLFKHSLK